MKKMFAFFALLLPMLTFADDQMIEESIQDTTAFKIQAIKVGYLRLAAALLESGRLHLELIINNQNTLDLAGLEAGHEVLWRTAEGTYQGFWCPTYKENYELMIPLDLPVLRFYFLASAILADAQCRAKLASGVEEALSACLSQMMLSSY